MMKTTTNEVVVLAVILKCTPYKENDMILHVYTKEYGKIGILAKGIRKMTSKNAAACQAMMMSEMTIHLKKGLSSLIRATPYQYFRHIKESIESEIVGNYILEYFYRYIEENYPKIEDYHILVESLKAIDYGYQPLLVYLLFNVFILHDNGVVIDVEGCVICGSPQVLSISLADGGFLCLEHLSHHLVYPVAVLKAFRHIHKIPMEKIALLHIDETTLKQLISIMDAYIEEYTGVSLRTKIFIQQIV